jgi:hypothetical protein
MRSLAKAEQPEPTNGSKVREKYPSLPYLFSFVHISLPNVVASLVVVVAVSP